MSHVFVRCHAYSETGSGGNMYLFKINFSRITPANLNGSE